MSLPLNVRHHQQDDSTSCGRASAQTVIGFEYARLGVAGGTALPDQPAMAVAETGSLQDWATEPIELASHINNGLLALSGAKIWAKVEFTRVVGVLEDVSNLAVASALLDVVLQKLDAGFPSVVMTDDNDHWETAYNYTIDSTDNSTNLYTVDPTPGLVSPLPTPHHSDTDACEPNQDTIWFLDATSARAFVCNTPPFFGSAIGIVQTDSVDPWAGGITIRRGINEVPITKPAPDPRFREAWTPRTVIGTIRDPLPPLDKNLQLIAVMNFFKRDLWRMLGAMEKLREAASSCDFDWPRVVVRHATFVNDPERKMAIVAVPPRHGKERSMLLSIGERGTVEAMRLTSSRRMVETLGNAGDEPLWIIPKYSRWLPFVRMGGDGPAARFRRLYDGFEMEMNERHENR